MPNRGGKYRKKGFFSEIRLPVADRYARLRSGTKMMMLGGIGSALMIGIFAFNIVYDEGTFVSNGPLSSNHALFGQDCATCHTPFQEVTDEKCQTCHEKYGDELGTHSFEAHYLYRSGDFTRVVAQANESSCFSCHVEHVGREAEITRVADNQCQACHEFDSFNDGHPEFDFVAEQQVDDGNLVFPHSIHVQEMLETQDVGDIEQTCLYCHNATQDGRNFEPIAFEVHCDACHLTSSTATPFMPAVASLAPARAGVASLETIRTQAGPGSLWTYYVNPDEFSERRGEVRKRPLYHEDAWVLENLRRLRNFLYPSADLAGLLATSADVPPQEARVLYDEAVATLRTHAEEVRSYPDGNVQGELDRIEDLLATIEKRLRSPTASLNEARFTVSRAELNPALNEDQLAAFDAIINDLTQPCQQCHLVEQATILRVRADQRTLTRAEFDHRAHITHEGCLDCHNVIPIQRYANSDAEPDPSEDHAGIYNLPSIASCQSCHSSQAASNTCVTCHEFHPDKSQRSNLLRYIE